MNMIGLISNFSINSKEVNATYKPGDAEDKIKLEFEINQKPNYLVLPYFGMFLTPNYTFIGYNYSNYPKSSLFKLFKSTQMRLGYGTKKSVSFHQFFKTYNDIDTEYLEELSSRQLGINIQEVKRESALIFRRYIERSPSLVFPFHGFADCSSFYYFKYGYKRRTNNVDKNKASPELLRIALNQDKVLGLKMGYSASYFETPTFEDGHTVDISAEYNTDSLNSRFVHLSSHFRKFFSAGSYCMQAHAKLDKIVTLGENTDIPINDRILLRNFKGVKDVGAKHYKNAEDKADKDKNRLPVGDCLGHKS